MVAHFHYVVFGTVVFAMFAGFYFWWPKFTGKMLDDKLGKLHFWLLFIGFHTTFLVQHWLGVRGHAAPLRRLQPGRRLHRPEHDLVGRRVPARRLDAAVLLQRLEDLAQARPKVTVDDPWGYGGSLEWATSCPPPRHNFTSLPRIRSERPAFDLHYPHVSAKTAALEVRPDEGPGWLFLLCGAVLRRRRRRLLVLDQGGPAREPVGTTAMAISVGFAFMIGYYLMFTARRIGDQPEDNKQAEISDGAGEIGFFSPHSWWPLFVCLAAALRLRRLRDRLVAVPDRRCS